MNRLKIVLLFSLLCLISCKPVIKNDNSVGDIELETYRLLTNKLTDDMKREFNGNMYESEKITAIETADGVKIGIPNGTSYLFKKDNSKFAKGDLNNDKKSDLIISATMNEARGPETKKYFLFLQDKDGYKYFAEFKGDEMVIANCHKLDLNIGVFNLDSISGGLLVGNTKYQGNHESYYLNYSYRCATEKYKLNAATKEFELVSQSDLLKKNDKTDAYEKVETK